MPTHNITLRGDVQDVGLRDLIADLAKAQDRRGIVFNEVDGTVRVVTDGPRSEVESFIQEIKRCSADLRAHIESVEIREVEDEIPLPPFMIPPTDDLADINRKLGQGVRRLGSIEESTDRLASIEESTDQVLENTDKLVDGQERMIDILDERL